METEKINLYWWIGKFIVDWKDKSIFRIVKYFDEWKFDEEAEEKRRHGDTWRDLKKWLAALRFWPVDSCWWAKETLSRSICQW
jgi:hypothetical protein